MSKKILGSIIVILIIAVGFYYQSQLSDDDGIKKVGFINSLRNLNGAYAIAYIEKGKILHALVIDVARQDEYTASLGRGAYLNDRRIRVSKSKGLPGSLLSNSSHDTDTGKVKHDNMSTFRSLYSHGLTIRRTGSAALDMANVAAGRLDGFWGSGLGMWDIAAGGLLVQEAGGLVSNYLGNPDYVDGDNIILSLIHI